MTIDLDLFCKEIKPERTAILFGAGSSLPSGAPTAQQLAESLAEAFKLDCPGMNLTEVASLIEIKHGRSPLINKIRDILRPIRPTGGILNLPNYSWRDIFTTNYDQVIEKSYARSQKPLSVISANYEFDKSYDDSAKLFKLHGTIEKDISDNDLSRIIITQDDYVACDAYRENLFDRFMIATSSSDLLIVGYSLNDSELMRIVDEAVRRKRETASPGRLYVLSYTKDENRSLLLTQRGLRVAFGGLDDFIAALDRQNAGSSAIIASTDDPLSFFPHLRPGTIDVAHARKLLDSDANRMFYGSPPNFADIESDLTFERDSLAVMRSHFGEDEAKLIYVLGVAGVGKTTLCRQFLSEMSHKGHWSWEHKDDVELKAALWVGVAQKLAEIGQIGYLFVDNAHKYMREISEIVDALSAKNFDSLRLLISTSSAAWNQRSKSENIFLGGRRITLRRLSRLEIGRLLDLFESNGLVATLVEKDFAGFSRAEKQRRLEQRCEADFFVCLKNIFSSDMLDEIVLREYAELGSEQQEIYRILAAFEASGVKLHRQMIIRTLNISAQSIFQILDDMDGLIAEYAVNEDLGIYAWSGRHVVVSNIILKSKFSDESKLSALYEKFIDLVNPTFDIERFNLMELCSKTGIGRISNRDRQNHLLGKIISKAPALRVPRHRLIDNLIRMGRYERAGSEIRIFESDLKTDAPVCRFRIKLLLERARHSTGLMLEDRQSLLREAAALSRQALDRFRDDISLHEIFCEVGLQFMRFSSDWDLIDEAISRFEERSNIVVDPEFSRVYARTRLKLQQVQSGKSG